MKQSPLKEGEISYVLPNSRTGSNGHWVVRRGNKDIDLPDDQVPQESKDELRRRMRNVYRLIAEHAGGEEGRKLIKMLDWQDQQEREFKEWQARMEKLKQEWEESNRRTGRFGS